MSERSGRDGESEPERLDRNYGELDTVMARSLAVTVSAAVAVGMVGLWVVLPVTLRLRYDREDQEASDRQQNRVPPA